MVVPPASAMAGVARTEPPSRWRRHSSSPDAESTPYTRCSPEATATPSPTTGADRACSPGGMGNRQTRRSGGAGPSDGATPACELEPPNWGQGPVASSAARSEEHTSELQSLAYLV